MVDLFEEGEESRDLSKVSPSLDESEFQGGGVCPSPKEKRKRDTVDITVATTICPFSLRKLSIYEDPLVWADSREKKGSPTAGVSRVR